MTLEILYDELVLWFGELLTERPFLTTPFSEYSVMEGLLLGILLSLIIGGVFKLARGCFSL